MPQSRRLNVLDASAVLAVVLDEPGRHMVLGLGRVALVSAVNVTEVRSRLLDKGSSDKTIEEALAGIEIAIVAFDAEQAKLAADLRRKTRPFGLSLGDRACLALGILKDAVVYTADRAWVNIDLPVEVKLVR